MAQNKDKGKEGKTRGEADGLGTEILLWQVAGWCVSFIPLACLLALRHETYFTGYTGLRVGSGVAAILAVCLMLALGKAKLPGRVVCLWALVGMVWLIIPLLEDILLLLLLLAVGVTVDELICQGRVRALRRRRERAERREDISEALRAAGEVRSDGDE